MHQRYHSLQLYRILKTLVLNQLTLHQTRRRRQTGQTHLNHQLCLHSILCPTSHHHQKGYLAHFDQVLLRLLQTNRRCRRQEPTCRLQGRQTFLVRRQVIPLNQM